MDWRDIGKVLGNFLCYMNRCPLQGWSHQGNRKQLGKLLKIINESKKKRNTLFAFSAGRISTGNGVVPVESTEKNGTGLGVWRLGAWRLTFWSSAKTLWEAMGKFIYILSWSLAKCFLVHFFNFIIFLLIQIYMHFTIKKFQPFAPSQISMCCFYSSTF